MSVIAMTPVPPMLPSAQAFPPDPEPSVSVDEFRSAFRHHPGGVSLITADGPGAPVALTATSVASVSADPPLLTFSVSAISSSFFALTRAETAVVHLLGPADRALAELGATSGIDRFADTSLWHRLPSGEPVFHGPRWLRVAIVHRYPVAGATLIVGRVVESGGRAADDSGLVYMNRSWHRIGPSD